jgi:hypothetical protein
MLRFSSLRNLSRYSRNYLLINLRRSHSKVGVLGVPFDKGQVMQYFFRPNVTNNICNTDGVGLLVVIHSHLISS